MKKVRWICLGCGRWLGSKCPTMSTWHKGKCDVCGKKRAVTQGRDYGVYEVSDEKGD